MPSVPDAPQFLVVLRPQRATFPSDATHAELETVAGHFAYLQSAVRTVRSGGVRVLLAGRTLVEASPIGLVILTAEDMRVARRFVDRDPAVVAGLFEVEVHPYAIAIEGLSGRITDDAATGAP